MARFRTAALDAALLILLTAVLIWPLFHVQYFDNWMSIDSSFIGDARFLSQHLYSPGWIPYFYCGNRYDYIYPPGVRYGSAMITRYGRVSPAQGYHIYTAILYCLSAACVYFLMLAGTRSRIWALAAGVASITLSPVMLIFWEIRQDSALHMPQHLNVIIKWGEVPHMCAMGVLLAALAAAWFGLRASHPGMLAAAAVCVAFAVSNNFYGGTALAILLPLMAWVLWAAYGDRRIWWRAVAIAVLSYALTACWLTPSYLALTARNLKLVQVPTNVPSQVLAVFFIVLTAAISYRVGRGKPDRAFVIFLSSATVIFGLGSLAAYYLEFHALGEFARFVPEFDILLVLTALEFVRRGPLVPRACAGLLLIASLVAGFPYLRHPWDVYVQEYHPERRIEYQLDEWLAKNLPGQRVHTASSLGLWSHAWQDVPQVGGIADQGLENLIISLANWQILAGDKAQRDIYWLQDLGADAIVVHGKRSQEIWHGLRVEHKFDGHLPVLYDSGTDDIIYRVPRRFPGLARVVERRRMETLPAIPWNNDDEPQLRAYAEAIEQGPDSPASTEWLNWRSMRVRARVGEGESVTVLETYDPAWRAYAGGSRLPIHKDVMGFMRVDPPPGEQEIRLDFLTPLENRIGRGVTFGGLIVTAILLASAVRRRETGGAPPTPRLPARS